MIMNNNTYTIGVTGKYNVCNSNTNSSLKQNECGCKSGNVSQAEKDIWNETAGIVKGLTIADKINNKADRSEIPTKISLLSNDSGYLTEVPSEYLTELELTHKGFLTKQDLNIKLILIVDNLTEGGSEKALSAELGKVLSDKIDYIKHTESKAMTFDEMLSIDSIKKLSPYVKSSCGIYTINAEYSNDVFVPIGVLTIYADVQLSAICEVFETRMVLDTDTNSFTNSYDYNRPKRYYRYIGTRSWDKHTDEGLIIEKDKWTPWKIADRPTVYGDGNNVIIFNGFSDAEADTILNNSVIENYIVVFNTKINAFVAKENGTGKLYNDWKNYEDYMVRADLKKPKTSMIYYYENSDLSISNLYDKPVGAYIWNGKRLLKL